MRSPGVHPQQYRTIAQETSSSVALLTKTRSVVFLGTPRGGTPQAGGSSPGEKPCSQMKVCHCIVGSERHHAGREKGVGRVREVLSFKGRSRLRGGRRTKRWERTEWMGKKRGQHHSKLGQEDHKSWLYDPVTLLRRQIQCMRRGYGPNQCCPLEPLQYKKCSVSALCDSSHRPHMATGHMAHDNWGTDFFFFFKFLFWGTEFLTLESSPWICKTAVCKRLNVISTDGQWKSC